MLLGKFPESAGPSWQLLLSVGLVVPLPATALLTLPPQHPLETFSVNLPIFWAYHAYLWVCFGSHRNASVYPDWSSLAPLANLSRHNLNFNSIAMCLVSA